MRSLANSLLRRLYVAKPQTFRVRRETRFGAAEEGSVLVIFGFAALALVGAVGLVADVGRWEMTHKNLQQAADSSALSAAVAYQHNGSAIVSGEANAIAATYKYVNGVGGTTVTANRPPLTGAYAGNVGAVEVIISQPQVRMFSLLFGSGKVPEHGRAVAVEGSNACVLALDPTAASAMSSQGSTNVTANGCSLYSNSNNPTSLSVGGTATMSAFQVGAVGGIDGQSSITTDEGLLHGGAIPDPYASVSPPSFLGCDYRNFIAHKTLTLTPGVYCGGITLNAGANVTMSPGIYYMDQGSLTVNGGATLTGTGVTIVFTSSTGNNYATAKIAGGATVNLTAPTTGPMAGIVLYGDRNMPLGTSFSLTANSGQSFTGAIYMPKGAVSYSGGAVGNNGCTQLIGDTVSFVGGSNFATNCAGVGVKQIGLPPHLVE